MYNILSDKIIKMKRRLVVSRTKGGVGARIKVAVPIKGQHEGSFW